MRDQTCPVRLRGVRIKRSSSAAAPDRFTDGVSVEGSGAEQGRTWEISFQISWQRLLAYVFFGLAVIILAYGFIIRRMVSTYVGEQVGQQISKEIKEELRQSLVTGLREPSVAPVIANGSVVAQVPTAAVLNQGVPVVQGQAATPASVNGQTIAQGILQQVAPATQVPGMVVTAQSVAATSSGQAAGVAPTADGTPPAESPTPAAATATAVPKDERTLEQVVAALPSGEITVTEEKLNAKIAARIKSLGPIDRAEIHFVPGALEVGMTVLGQDARVSSGLAVSSGRVVVINPVLDGPLALLISVDDLVRPIEEELNNTLEATDRYVRDVRIEQGQIVVMLD